MGQVARLFIVLSTLFCGACSGRTGSAVTLPSGGKVAILVLANRGDTANMLPEEHEQLDQLGRWLEEDLLAILGKTGYSAVRVGDASVTAAPGRYLLRTRVVSYNAGSKAARMLVGFGAGSARLDTHYELVGPDGKVYVAGAPSVASGRDWKNAARKVNLQTVDAVNARLHQSL